MVPVPCAWQWKSVECTLSGTNNIKLIIIVNWTHQYIPTDSIR